MARGKAHSDEVRAQVMAALLAGQGVNEVAQTYNLPKQTVSRMKAGLSDADLGQVGTKKSERIEALLYDYLTANLSTLRKQTEVAGDTEYLKKQPASELATLHGVMADKAIRILEAAERAGVIESA
jgi:transposase-like protein